MPIDLTTIGAAVSPQELFAHPEYVPTPPLPPGEPDHHELARSVFALSQRLVALEDWKRRCDEVLEVL
jgi:hypothetical protein